MSGSGYPVDPQKKLLPPSVTQQDILNLMRRAPVPGPQGPAGASIVGPQGPAGAAGADISSDTADQVDSTTDDFDYLLIWIVATFGEVPPGLEERYAQALARK
jgi:hypothetical protein